MEILGLSMTPEHFIFIPSVLFLGMVIGFFIGQSFKIPSDSSPPNEDRGNRGDNP